MKFLNYDVLEKIERREYCEDRRHKSWNSCANGHLINTIV